MAPLSTIVYWLTLSSLASTIIASNAVLSGSTNTTRGWACCQLACSVPGAANVTAPVTSCDANNNPLSDSEYAQDGCQNGTAYHCADQGPWEVDENTAYGYAAVEFGAQKTDTYCCACYNLTYTSGPIKGKTMTVQAVNEETYPGNGNGNMFSIGSPGSGGGQTPACAHEYQTSNGIWGLGPAGVGNSSQCDNLPEALRDGCRFRFNWLENSLMSTADFKRVQCPVALTDKTGCIRHDEDTFVVPPPPGHLSRSNLATIGIFVPLGVIIGGSLAAYWIITRRQRQRQQKSAARLTELTSDESRDICSPISKVSDTLTSHGIVRTTEVHYYELDSPPPIPRKDPQELLEKSPAKEEKHAIIVERPREVEGSPTSEELAGDTLVGGAVQLTVQEVLSRNS